MSSKHTKKVYSSFYQLFREDSFFYHAFMLMSREPGYISWHHFKNWHVSCGAKRICSCAFCVAGVLIYPRRPFSGRGLPDLPPNLPILLSLNATSCRMPSWGIMPLLLCGPAWGRRVLVPLGTKLLSLHILVQYFLATCKGWMCGVSVVFVPLGEIELLYLKSLLLRVTVAGKSPSMLRTWQGFCWWILVMNLLLSSAYQEGFWWWSLVDPFSHPPCPLRLLIWKGKILDSPLLCQSGCAWRCFSSHYPFHTASPTPWGCGAQ